MGEMSQALNEMVACGEGLIRTANAIREMFTGEPKPQHATKEAVHFQ